MSNRTKLSALEEEAQRLRRVREQHYVSFADLVNLKEYKDLCEQRGVEEVSAREIPSKLLKKMLFGLGIDTEKRVDRTFCKHRTYTNKVYTGFRWEGLMRVDKPWVDMIFDKIGVRINKPKKKKGANHEQVS